MRYRWAQYCRVLALAVAFLCLSVGISSCIGPSPDSITITFWGAAQEVAGACFQLDVGNESILVDCGSFFDTEDQPFASTPKRSDSDFKFAPKDIDAVLVTHAHEDHTKRIIYLVDKGFSGPIYMTKVTAELFRVTLSDNIDYAEPPVHGETESRIVKSIKEVNYGTSLSISNRITATFIDAGHIPGSASILLSVRLGKETHRILFSGDVGSGSHPFLNPPDYAALQESGAEILVLESTYGATIREQSSGTDPYARFFEELRDGLEQRELVVIPTFALDRTQRVLAAIGEGLEKGLVPPGTKVAVGGKSSCQFTEKYVEFQHKQSLYSDYFSTSFWADAPLAEQFWEYTRKPSCSSPEPPSSFDFKAAYDIIVTPSGTGDSSLSKVLIEKYANDPEVKFIKVGWAPADSHVGKLSGVADVSAAFSGHADQKGLLSYAQACQPKAHRIILTHGEINSMQVLKSELQTHFPDVIVDMPQYGQKIKLFGGT